VSPDALRRRRAAAQLLSRPGTKAPEEIVRHLLAVQAQDLRSARLALRARGEGFAAADVDRALEEGGLVVAWLMRGTLHLVRREDYGWLHALTAPTRLTANRRRLAQEGVSEAQAERAVGIVERALADEGPLTRGELAKRIAAKGIRTEGQALPHLLMLAALRGVAVRRVEAFAPAEPAAVDREAAVAELSRRYLVAHGPASPADLAAWAGLPLRDLRAGLRAVAPLELGDGLLDLPRNAPAGRPPPRLLPAFDPYLLGWKDRTFAVPAEHVRRVHPGGGMLRATAVVDGAVVGTWSTRGLDLFASVSKGAERALAAELESVARF
jgi:hypothetical protein